MYEAERGGT